MASSSLWLLSAVRQNKTLLSSYCSQQPWKRQQQQLLTGTTTRANSSLVVGRRAIAAAAMSIMRRNNNHDCRRPHCVVVVVRGISLVSGCGGKIIGRNSFHSRSRLLVGPRQLQLPRQQQLQQLPQQQPYQSFHKTSMTANNTNNIGRPPSPRVQPTTTTTTTSSASASSSSPPPATVVTKSFAGTGRPAAAAAAVGSSSSMEVVGQYAENKTPVSWTMLFLVGIAAATAVSYYRIERERRLERAMGKVVSSELNNTNNNNNKDEGWSPSPLYGKRVFVPTKYGWFPKDDGWTAGKFCFCY